MRRKNIFQDPFYVTVILTVLVVTALICLTGCATANAPSSRDPILTERIPLYWENTTAPHPERKPWSDALVKEVRKNLSDYSKAKDIKEICPRFESLNEDQKVKGISEFFVALAFYESGFNPKSSSVDVGNKDNRNSYSDGLFQVSGTDRVSRSLGYTYQDLLKPIPNIEVATEIFRRQISNCGEFILPNSSKCRYFATLLEGNKYNKIKEIKARVLKHAKECAHVEK